jgi:hypothetical protein
VAAAAGKCFYFQSDEWTGSVQQGSEPETWHWSGRYFFDKAKGIGGVSVTDYRIGGTPMDATPYVPPEYASYFAPGGGGGVIVTEETNPDPECAQKVDSDEEQAAVYSGIPDYGDCVAPGGKIRARKVGRARLGASPEQVRKKVGPPRRSTELRDRWCVVGGGKMTVFYKEGESASIKTTTPGHSIRGVGPGSTKAELRNAGFDGNRRAKLWILPRGRFDREVLARVKNGAVRWMVMVS